MTAIEKLDQIVTRLLNELSVPEPGPVEVDTRRVLTGLAATSVWGSGEWESFDFLSKRIDIGGKLYLSYCRKGRRTDDEELNDGRWLDLAVAVFLKAALHGDALSRPDLALKRFNTLYKLLDLRGLDGLSAATELSTFLDDAWASLLSVLPNTNIVQSITESPPPPEPFNAEVPLTVLFYEGAIARAYLATIRSIGLKPKKIINLVAGRDVATRRPVGRWLPSSMRTSYAASIQRRKIHYWPKMLAVEHKAVHEAIADALEGQFFIERKIFTEAQTLLPLTEYSADVETLLIDDLKDSRLQSQLQQAAPGLMLFTGGGIMPTSVLSIEGLRHLHVHPGYLPQIRGADCALWSTLLTGHLSASCFFLAPGIDVGDIVLPAWLPKLQLQVQMRDISVASQYRIAYAFIDPWVRAYVLRQVLMTNPTLEGLSSTPQAVSNGTTFHFMHDRVRQAALANVLSQRSRSPS